VIRLVPMVAGVVVLYNSGRGFPWSRPSGKGATGEPRNFQPLLRRAC